MRTKRKRKARARRKPRGGGGEGEPASVTPAAGVCGNIPGPMGRSASPCGSPSWGAGEWCGDAQATSCCALEAGKALLRQMDLTPVAALEMRHLFDAEVS